MLNRQCVSQGVNVKARASSLALSREPHVLSGGVPVFDAKLVVRVTSLEMRLGSAGPLGEELPMSMASGTGKTERFAGLSLACCYGDVRGECSAVGCLKFRR